MCDVVSACEFWYVIRALDEFREDIDFAMALERFKKIPTAKRCIPSHISYNEDNPPAPLPKECPRCCKFASYGCVPPYMVWLCDDSETYKYVQAKYSVPANIDGVDITCFSDLVDAYFPLYESMRK